MTEDIRYDPRIRVEWLVAGTRVALAAGTLFAVIYAPVANVGLPITYVIGWYLAYSLALLPLVWTPVRYGRGWDIAVHLGDLAVFTLLIRVAEAASCPVLVFFVFLVINATLRWQMPGTLRTAAGAIALQVVATLYFEMGSRPTNQWLDEFVIRTVSMAVIAVLVGYVGAHQFQFQREIARLASWPRKLPRDPRDLVAEIIHQSAKLLGAPRVVVVWEEPGEGWINIASQSNGQTLWSREPEATYGGFVLPALERKSFQSADVTAERARVLVLTPTGFRRRECHPVNPALRARFGMTTVQSWPLDGELVHGRLFCLDKTKLRIDELILGEVAARFVVSRLDSLYLQVRLREAAALNERVRVARELHDSLLQSQAGVALQLLAARRLMDRDPAAGKERLADIQRQLERDELDMRSFITRLRPSVDSGTPQNLAARLEELRQRVERQWDVNVRMWHEIDDTVSDEIVEDVYRLAQEGVINAARHADASVIQLVLSLSATEAQLRITDDGQGFPFRGTFDLPTLNASHRGPLTLKERVAALGGTLSLTSLDIGTELLISLPLTVAVTR